MSAVKIVVSGQVPALNGARVTLEEDVLVDALGPTSFPPEAWSGGNEDFRVVRTIGKCRDERLQHVYVPLRQLLSDSKLSVDFSGMEIAKTPDQFVRIDLNLPARGAPAHPRNFESAPQTEVSARPVAPELYDLRFAIRTLKRRLSRLEDRDPRRDPSAWRLRAKRLR